MPPTSTLTGTAQDRAAAIAQRCGGGHESRSGWKVCCPAHDDRNPSLHITPREGKVLLYCFAGCPEPAILAALRLTDQDLFEAQDWQRSSRPKPRTKPTPRRMPPPGYADPIVLAYTVDVVIGDVEMLTIDGVRNVLTLAACSPLQWLWVEQAFREAGMSPSVVWQVLFPHAEEPYPPRRGPTSRDDIRVQGRPLPSIRLGEMYDD